jgi:hypothetical protein
VETLPLHCHDDIMASLHFQQENKNLMCIL